MPQSTLVNWTRELLERDYYEPRDTAGDITNKMRIDLPHFERRLDPTTFADSYHRLKSNLIGMICPKKGDFDLQR